MECSCGNAIPLIKGHEGEIGPPRSNAVIAELMNILKDRKPCNGNLCSVTNAIIYLKIATLEDEMKLKEAAINSLNKCIDFLNNREHTREGIIPAIIARNQLFKHLKQEALDILKQADNLYVTFTRDINLVPVHMMTIIMGGENMCAQSILKKQHMLTLDYLARLYKQLQDDHNFVLYCHRLLSMQWSEKNLTHDLDYLDWVENSVLISQCFLRKKKFPQVRHYLAAASYVLEQYLEILKKKGAADYNAYYKTSAFVARSWGQYGTALLRESKKKRLLERVKEEDEESKPAEVSGEHEHPESKTIEALRFLNLEPKVKSIADKITDMYPLNSDYARQVFWKVKEWLNKAKKYYTFETNAYTYKCIAQDLSDVCKYMVFFEEDKDRLATIYQQQIHILEEINSKESDRTILLELAETYSAILDLKTNRFQLQPDVAPMMHMQVAEIEGLARSSIQYYRSYLEGLEDSDRVGFFSDDNLHSELHSYFCIGNLHNKMKILNIQQIENTQDSLKAYKVIVDYYNENPEKQKELDKWDFVTLSKKYVTS